MLNTRNIREAIRVMDDVRDNRKPFNMTDWVEDKKHPNDCGTAACFAGWLARDEFFVKHGLTLEGWWRGTRLWGESNETAIAKLLGCGPGTACDLIYPEYYHSDPSAITPQMVIDKLTELLTSNGPNAEVGTNQ